MKKLSKMMLFIALFAVIISAVMPVMNVYADSTSLLKNVESNQDFNAAEGKAGDVAKMAGQVLSLIQVASVIAAVILVAVFGFKYIMGSAEGKAEYMKSFIPLIVGVVVVFSASSIARLILSISGNG